jgi:hypothetical protein
VPPPSRPLHSAQPVSEFTINLFLRASDDCLLHHHHDVDGCAGSFLAAPEALPKEAPRTIPHRRLSHPATHRHAEPVGGTAIRQHDEKKVRPVQPSTPAKDALELRPPPQAAFRREAQPAHGTLLPSGRQALPPLLPPPLQHQATALRSHPHEEPVRPLAPPVVRLKRALHRGPLLSWRFRPAARFRTNSKGYSTPPPTVKSAYPPFLVAPPALC